MTSLQKCTWQEYFQVLRGLAGLAGSEFPDNYHLKNNVGAHCLKLEIWCTYVYTNERVL
jgi:hypothetical protein